MDGLEFRLSGEDSAPSQRRRNRAGLLGSRSSWRRASRAQNTRVIKKIVQSLVPSSRPRFTTDDHPYGHSGQRLDALIWLETAIRISQECIGLQLPLYTYTACSLRLAPFRGTDLFFDDHDEWIRL